MVSSNQQAVLEATDEKHPRGVSIVTATPVDAKYNGMTITSVADQWQAILQTALREALLKRQPGVERRNVLQVLVTAAVLVVVSVLIWMLIVAPIRQRARNIEHRLAEQEAKADRKEAEPPADDAPVHRRRRFLASALRTQDPERQLGILRAIAATLIWVLVLVWFAVLVWAFFLFPQTTPLAHQVVQTLLSVAAIWIGAGLFNRLLDLAIARLAIVWRRRHFVSAEDRARECCVSPRLQRPFRARRRPSSFSLRCS